MPEGLEYMLQNVKDYMLNAIDTKDFMLREMAMYFAQNQGKMLRPRLTLFCGLIENPENVDMDELYRAAAGVEILHMSALVHDDILDEGEIRRGKPSINALYGRDKALLLGDYFYALMVEGEIKQQRQAFDFTTSVKDYMVRITYKTASLTSLSCFAGACTGKLPDDKVKLLVKMGQDLGKAYQIRDDIMDFMGDEQHLKKPASDLDQGTITLPMILLLKMTKPQNPHAIFSYIKNGQLRDGNWTAENEICVAQLKKAAVNKAAQYCNRFLTRCIKYLDNFPSCKIKENMAETIENIYIDT